MKKIISALIVPALMFALMSGLALEAPAADTEAEAARVCSACHSTKRICMSLGIKSGAAWKDTVTRMVHNGAQLPLSRVDEFAGYLAGLNKGQGPLCR